MIFITKYIDTYLSRYSSFIRFLFVESTLMMMRMKVNVMEIRMTEYQICISHFPTYPVTHELFISKESLGYRLKTSVQWKQYM